MYVYEVSPKHLGTGRVSEESEDALKQFHRRGSAEVIQQKSFAEEVMNQSAGLTPH